MFRLVITFSNAHHVIVVDEFLDVPENTEVSRPPTTWLDLDASDRQAAARSSG